MADEARVQTCDVAVVGAGPAGTAAAATLARAGRSVLVLERERLPRFHIGESMLPYSMPLLGRLGVLDRVASQGYVVKRGAEFVAADGTCRRVDFADQGPDRPPTTYQLERAHFDHLLADHARSCGARVVEGAGVRDLELDGERVTALRYRAGGRERVARPRFVLDAGGRGSKIAHTLRLRRTIDHLRNVAVHGHFGNFDERGYEGVPGDIQIGSHADGWLWAIPIWPHTLSLGAVMPRAVLQAGGTPEELLAEHVARVPRIARRAEGTRLSSVVRVDSDYSYVSDRLTGPNWALIGDAGCFVDPIFSGGVYLALLTGLEVARAVDAVLGDPDRGAASLHRYERLYKTGYDTYARMIYAYYASGYALGRYLQEAGMDLGEPWFPRILAGDFWSADNPVGALLRANPEWNTFAPFDPLLECPVYGRPVPAGSAAGR